jgi:hypothetical protein
MNSVKRKFINLLYLISRILFLFFIQPGIMSNLEGLR